MAAPYLVLLMVTLELYASLFYHISVAADVGGVEGEVPQFYLIVL